MTTNDPFTPIKQRLLDVLANQPDTIVPALAKKIVVASAWILPDMSVNAIEEVIVDLTDLADMATEYGRPDIDDELEEITEALRAELPELPDLPEATGCEVYINFPSGAISGDCFSCNAAEVADALIAVAEALRHCDETPELAGFADNKPYVEGED